MKRDRQHPKEGLQAWMKVISFWPSRAVLTAAELDVFNVLVHGRKTAAEVARQVKADERGTELLLNALAGLGMLEKRGERFTNAPAALESFVKGSPRYMGDMLMHAARLWESWSRLTEAVRTGKPARGPVWGPAEAEGFALAMHNNALQCAPVAAQILKPLLGSRRSLLDVGGGPGTYSVFFAKTNPKLCCTVLDLPATLKVTRRVVEQFGLSNRISLFPCDYKKEAMPSGYDAAWLSHVIHSEDEGGNRRLVAKAFGALNPGGLILIQDFVLNEARTAPVSNALFALNMLVNTPAGRTYTAREIGGWLKKAGFRNVRKLPMEMPREAGIVCGRKPR